MMTTIVIAMLFMTRINTVMTTGNQLAEEKEKKRGPHKGVKKLLVACTKNVSLFANMF